MRAQGCECASPCRPRRADTIVPAKETWSWLYGDLGSDTLTGHSADAVLHRVILSQAVRGCASRFRSTASRPSAVTPFPPLRPERAGEPRRWVHLALRAWLRRCGASSTAARVRGGESVPDARLVRLAPPAGPRPGAPCALPRAHEALSTASSDSGRALRRSLDVPSGPSTLPW